MKCYQNGCSYEASFGIVYHFIDIDTRETKEIKSFACPGHATELIEGMSVSNMPISVYQFHNGEIVNVHWIERQENDDLLEINLNKEDLPQ
jgi:hypothetical protein